MIDTGEVKAGRKLDMEIAERVFQAFATPLGLAERMALPHYSTDIRAAWLVVEKMRARGCVIGLGVYSDGVLATIDSGSDDWYATADTAPLAICQVALAALDAE